MALEQEEHVEDVRDRTWLVWGSVVALLLIMVGALYVAGRPDPNISSVRARHVLVSFDKGDPADRQRALELIGSLRQQILDGASFAKIASDYSDDPYSAARGGDLGYHNRGVFDPKFEEYVWSGPVNELSDVIESSHGFHIIEIIDRHLTEQDQYEMELEERARQRGAQ